MITTGVLPNHVSKRTLVRRINKALLYNGGHHQGYNRLRFSRASRELELYGRVCVVRSFRGKRRVIRQDVDLIQLGRELGVLPNEEVLDDGPGARIDSGAMVERMRQGLLFESAGV